MRPGAPIKDPVQVYYKFKNDEKSSLGMPLPAGNDAHLPGRFARRHALRREKTTSTTRPRTKTSACTSATPSTWSPSASRPITRSFGGNSYEMEYEITLRNHKAMPDHRGSERAHRRRLGDPQLDVQVDQDGRLRRAVRTCRWTRTARRCCAESRALALPRMMSTYSRWLGSRVVSERICDMPMTPFMGVRISWLELARKLLLARLAASAASLASSVACSASLRSVMSWVEPAKRKRRAVRGTLRLRARAHPFVMPGLVQRAKFHVVDRAVLEVIHHDLLDHGAVLGMDQRLDRSTREVVDPADAVAQHFLEAMAEPGDYWSPDRFPTGRPGCRAPPARSGSSMESSAALVRFKSLMSTMAPVMRTTSPGLAARHRGLLADPALAAAVEQHPVFAAIGGLFGRGFGGRAAHARDIIRMHPGDQRLDVIERSRGRYARGACGNCRSKYGCSPGEIEVEGGNARPRPARCRATRWHSAASLPVACAG